MSGVCLRCDGPELGNSGVCSDCGYPLELSRKVGDIIGRLAEKNVGVLSYPYRVPLRFGEPCNCDQALALRQKTLRLGLLLALRYLRSVEPSPAMTGRDGTTMGDAHRRWRVRFRRVRSMLGDLKATNRHAAELDSSGMLGLGEAPTGHHAVAVVEQADAQEPGHDCQSDTSHVTMSKEQE